MGVGAKEGSQSAMHAPSLNKYELIFGEGMQHFSVKKGVFSEKGGGNSVNGGYGKDSSGKAIQ